MKTALSLAGKACNYAAHKLANVGARLLAHAHVSDLMPPGYPPPPPPPPGLKSDEER